LLFYSEDEGSIFFWNVNKHVIISQKIVTVTRTSYPTRLTSLGGHDIHYFLV
jgi:hypothetical protein